HGNTISGEAIHILGQTLRPELSQSDTALKALQLLGARVAATGQLLGAAVTASGNPFLGIVISSGIPLLTNLIKTDESDKVLQDKVVRALKNSCGRFLVIIDDIDRLSPDEALVIFRLVKSVGRLPNVIYLLAYDRITTEKAVEQRYPSEGSHYLEKIVQAGFDLPEPSQFQLIDMFNSQIAEIFDDEDIGDQHYFSNMFHAVVAPEFRTPRDVLRLSNALSVTFQAVRGEVNAADFLAIETLRLFRPGVYQSVRSQKSVLVGMALDAPRGSQKEVADKYEQLFLGKESQNDGGRLKDGLQKLFPRLQSIWSNTHDTDDKEWAKARRVCSQPHFDTYFRFALSPYAVPLREVRELVRRADEPEFVKSAFLNALGNHLGEGRTKASFLLEELACHAGDMEIRKVTPFLQALYSIADDLQVENDDVFPTDNKRRLYQLTAALLLNRTELPERSKILFNAIQNASLGWLVYIINSVSRGYQSPRDDEAHTSPNEFLMTKNDVQSITEVALQRIREAAGDGSILEVKDLAFVLFRWRDMAGDSLEEVQGFCNAALEDDQSIIKFARAFLGHSFVGQFGDFVGRKIDQAQVNGIEILMDAGRFQERLSEVLDSASLEPDDQDIVQRFLNAWQQGS
ncbi:MAG: P-loop NTPase fold protein, partial [Albidovulum sp.]|nr:P-loop NTPase fold protein [Albidovulum sp.]